MQNGSGRGLHSWANTLLDHDVFSSVELDANSVIRSASDGFFARTGYSAGELEGAHWARLPHPDDAGWRSGAEIRLQRKDGGWSWFRAHRRELPDGGAQVLLEDVTRSRQTQAELLAAKERFECAVAGSADGIWDRNLDTNEDYFSDRWCELLGFSREELKPCSQTWVELLHPEDRESAMVAVERHLAGQGAYDLEYRIRNKNGEYRWYRARGQAIWDSSGRPVRIAGSLKDIHDRKLDQMRLAELNNRYEAAILASGQVVYEWDTVTDETKWLGDLEGMLGEPVTGLTGELWLARLHPEDRESASKAVGSFLTSKDSLRLEYRIRKACGTWIHVEDRARFFKDVSGETRRVIGCVADITDRKRLALEILDAKASLEQRVVDRTRELERTRRDLELALEGANEAVWEWTAPDSLAISPEFGSLLGFEEPVKAHPDDYAETLAAFHAHRDGLKPVFEGELRLARLDGTWDWVLARGKAAERNARGVAVRVAGTISRIGERKEMEGRLRGAIEAAEQANRAKSLFLASMSHEIRTPMNGIIGMSELLAATSLDADQRDYASHIRTSAENLLVVINDILDFSKIEAGKVDLESIPFDVVCLVEDAMDLLGHRAASKGVQMICDIDVRIKRQIVGDPTRIRQILLNLLSNAVKFTGQGSVMARTSLTDAGTRLRFEVIDTGIGIAGDALPLLFQAFSQVDASTTRKFAGTGLGLAISKQLTSLMGGEIGAMSQPGQGSTFWFELPVQWAEAPSGIAALGALEGSAVAMGPMPEPSSSVLRGYLAAWGVSTSAMKAGVPRLVHAEAGEIPGVLASRSSGPLILITTEEGRQAARECGGPLPPVLVEPVRPSELLSHLLPYSRSPLCSLPA